MAVLWNADPQRVHVRWSTVSDAKVYDRFGWNLADEGVLGVGQQPSAFSLPAYPLMLASIYKVSGHRPGTVRWVQVVLGTLTVLFIGRLARRLGGDTAEVLSVLAGAIYPYFLYFTREILTETLFLFAFTGMLLAAVRVGEHGRILDGVLHGAFAVLALLTRPAGLILEAGALIFARPWARDNRRRRLAGLALGSLVVASAWGGWIYRNWRIFGEPVLFDTHGGFALYVGQLFSRDVPEEEIRRRVGYGRADIENARLPGGPHGELEADRRAGEAALLMIREDPAAFLATFPRNVRELWLGMDFGDVAARGGGLSLFVFIGFMTYVPLLLAALAGLTHLYLKRNWLWLSAIVTLLLLTTALHAIVLGGKRYRVATVDPLLLVVAAGSAGAALDRRFRYRAVERSRP